MTGMPDELGRRYASNAGFQVVLADLLQTAGRFGTESVAFWTIMPPSGPAGVDGGSAEFNAALTEMLTAIGGVHTQMTAAIAQHGSNLREAYKNYKAAEENIVDTIDRIMNRGAHG
jgi:hypothetical protein